jgi:hypothetical protein
MRTHAFPVCCGAQIITDFGFTNNFHTGDGPTQTMSQAAKEAISTYLKDYIRGSYTGMTVIMLNSAQVKAGVEKLVLDAGWELVTDGAYYPGHGRHLTLYVYYHHPDKRVSKKTDVQGKNLVRSKETASTSDIKTEKSKPGPIRKASLRLFSDVSSPAPTKKRLVRRRVKKAISSNW